MPPFFRQYLTSLSDSSAKDLLAWADGSPEVAREIIAVTAREHPNVVAELGMVTSQQKPGSRPSKTK